MMASTVGRRSLPVLGQPSRSRRVTRATKAARTVTTCFSGDEKAVVKFRLVKKVAFGQGIALVGSQEGLGAWDPKGAVGLEWHEGNEWVAEAELPVGEQVEYKYVVTSANGSVAWQPGKNMVLSVPADARKKVVVVVDDWEQKQKPAVKVEPGEQLDSPSEGEMVESLDEELVQPFAKAVSPTAAAPAPPAAALEALPAPTSAPTPTPTPVLPEDPAPAPAPVEASAAAAEPAVPGSSGVNGTHVAVATQQLEQQELPRQEVAAVNGMQQGGRVMGAVVGAAIVSQPLEDMTVKALRELAKEYGVPVSGRKMDLVDRIKDAMGMAD